MADSKGTKSALDAASVDRMVEEYDPDAHGWKSLYENLKLLAKSHETLRNQRDQLVLVVKTEIRAHNDLGAGRICDNLEVAKVLQLALGLILGEKK